VFTSKNCWQILEILKNSSEINPKLILLFFSYSLVMVVCFVLEFVKFLSGHK
jgi:hypothetical protein